MKTSTLLTFLILLVATLLSNATNLSGNNNSVYLKQMEIGQWEDSEGIMTQYSITINNNSTNTIKSIIISTDETLCLRDVSSIWNIELKGNGDLVLPPGTDSISPYGDHTFYFILMGVQKANLLIKSIIYL